MKFEDKKEGEEEDDEESGSDEDDSDSDGEEDDEVIEIKSVDSYFDDEEPYDSYKEFNDWCLKEGVLTPKLEYPAYFEDGLLGVRCKEDI